MAGILDDEYEYDDNGNRIGEGHETDVPNRLVSDGRNWYDYDNEGNLITRYDTVTFQLLTFTWDHRNRLVEIHEEQYSQEVFDLSYEYDVFNRRVSRTETITADGGEGGSETETTAEKFVYDGDDVVLDFYKPNGGSFALARRYLHGPAVDQVLAQENVAEGLGEADRVYWMLADNQGTVRDIVDHAGAAVGHFTYDAFGNVLSGDTSLTRYLYTGREFDATTGLQYNRERWYDSHTGRWLSEDPIGFNDGSNNYVYVGNSPTNFTDPLGLARVTQTAVSKSYINTITNVGSLPTWAATSKLWYFAQFTNNSPYVHDGNVTTPAADGRYRLRARIDIAFDVNCDKISNLNVTHSEQGGQELPGVSGTINVHQWEDRVSDSVVKIGWLTWGRPSKLLEPVFQGIYPRTSVNIWHQVILTVSGNGSSADFTVEEIIGSDFPSHRLWVGAGIKGNLPQGAYSSLWRSDTIKGEKWVTRDGTGPFADPPLKA